MPPTQAAACASCSRSPYRGLRWAHGKRSCSSAASVYSFLFLFSSLLPALSCLSLLVVHFRPIPHSSPTSPGPAPVLLSHGSPSAPASSGAAADPEPEPVPAPVPASVPAPVPVPVPVPAPVPARDDDDELPAPEIAMGALPGSVNDVRIPSCPIPRSSNTSPGPTPVLPLLTLLPERSCLLVRVLKQREADGLLDRGLALHERPPSALWLHVMIKKTLYILYYKCNYSFFRPLE
ncbi:hypothetical protein DFH07DRAFT_389647 [Mycena maculata]|uniref:Uncharacterized protein n=1 Tax=Mycena maculata TaxID=230809 RepID=A0AAD7KAN7_9AGAR|nr:hypothetical protein DFH07DRAFT_8823 [Mycena maculata]KAJ7781851.1 hypothetical protein DFH07DRAFT_389647 [Mycena maculata]